MVGRRPLAAVVPGILLLLRAWFTRVASRGAWQAGVALLALAAIVFSKQMKLDRKTHLIVLQEVARIKAGGKLEDITPEVRVVIEDLVGHRYEECWGNSKLFKDEQPASARAAISH